MGITESLTGAVLVPLNAQISERGLAVVAAVGFASFIALTVVLNVLSQLLFKNPNEPPLVFHWFPIIGNTISYGMDPYPFFFKCREKVREYGIAGRRTKLTLLVWRYLHLYPPRKEDDRIPWNSRQRVYSQWQAQGCERGGDLHSTHHASFRNRSCLRLPQLEAHGAEEGMEILICQEIIIY